MNQYSQYSFEDPRNPLGWRAVRRHIEDSVQRDFLRRTGREESGILSVGFRPRGPGILSRIAKVFRRHGSIPNYFTQPTQFDKPGFISSGAMERPGFIKPGGMERPGFISIAGWDD